MILPLAGGVLIGTAVTIMLLFNGRVTGISGIISGLLTFPRRENLWRWFFISGMLAGGLTIRLLLPGAFENSSGRGLGIIAVAGLLVGFGTVMGGGCTSGHGICGVSRLSMRSILATLTFMIFGVLSVTVAKYFLGSPL